MTRATTSNISAVSQLTKQKWSSQCPCQCDGNSACSTSENRTLNSIFLPISSRIWVHFKVWSIYSTWVRLLVYKAAFMTAGLSWRSQNPKPLYNCVKSLGMWWHTDASASKCPATSYSLYTLRRIQTFTLYKVNNPIKAGLDLGGQVLSFNKDILTILFKAFSFDWKWLELFYSIFFNAEL